MLGRVAGRYGARRFVISQIKEIEKARQKRLKQEPESGPHAMVRLMARVVGIGIENG
jgi:transposase